MITSGLMSSNSNEWCTPRDLFNQLDNEFGFNLDPCSTDDNALCAHHFTKETDGLVQDWGGGIAALLTHHTGARSGFGFARLTRRV